MGSLINQDKRRSPGVAPTPAGSAENRDAEAAPVRSSKGPAREDDIAARVRCVVLAGGLILLVVLVTRAAFGGATFPASARLPLGDWIERFADWAIESFEFLYGPVANGLSFALDMLIDFLESVPAPSVAVVLVGVVFTLAGFRLALLTVVFMFWVIAAGVWAETLETFAFMSVAVGVAVVIGIAVGIVASLNPFLENFTRTAIDALQSFPYFAYLVVVVVIFGPGDTAALFVTIIWAVGPIARMTTVGIRGVSAEVVEAATSAGATTGQILRQIRLPMARPSIRSGLNQTILYAISMATIATLIGGSGLGEPVWSALSRLEFGQALEAGIAIVLLAVILDRVSEGSHVAKFRTSSERPLLTKLPASWSTSARRRRLVVSAAVVVPFTVVAGIVPAFAFMDFSSPPAVLELSLRGPVKDLVASANEHLGALFEGFTYAVQVWGLNPIVDLLTWIPWQAILLLGFVLGTLSLGFVDGTVVLASLALIGTLGLWTPAIYTIAVVGVAMVASLSVGFSLGVLMSRSDRFAGLLRPVLDVLQTLPVFLFVLPSVIFLGSGPVPGVLATFLYAVSPIIRMTNTALRGTDPGVLEAARSSGATDRQILLGVRVPLGMPTIAVGVNQTIILALAMAVVSAFIGTPGLGEEVLAAVSQAQLGRGVEAGLSLFLLAVLVDRLFAHRIRRFGSMPAVRPASRTNFMQRVTRRPT